MKYSISYQINKDEADFVQKKLVEFADQFTGPRNYREFGITLRNDDGEVVGGLTANTVWDWLQIGVLWIPDDLRGEGHGYKLLSAAESKARDMGCKYSRLDTFEFEAREFYERNGYSVHSQTDDFPKGHTHFHLQKVLSDGRNI